MNFVMRSSNIARVAWRASAQLSLSQAPRGFGALSALKLLENRQVVRFEPENVLNVRMF